MYKNKYDDKLLANSEIYRIEIIEPYIDNLHGNDTDTDGKLILYLRKMVSNKFKKIYSTFILTFYIAHQSFRLNNFITIYAPPYTRMNYNILLHKPLKKLNKHKQCKYPYAKYYSIELLNGISYKIMSTINIFKHEIISIGQIVDNPIYFNKISL